MREAVSHIFKLFGVFFILLLTYVIWQFFELQHFNRTRYEITSDKLTEEHRWVVISDLHLWRYGAHNEKLVSAIREEAPDAQLILQPVTPFGGCEAIAPARVLALQAAAARQLRDVRVIPQTHRMMQQL